MSMDALITVAIQLHHMNWLYRSFTMVDKRITCRLDLARKDERCEFGMIHLLHRIPESGAM